MTSEISRKQRALRQIWESTGVDHLMKIMRGSAEARDPGLIEELEAEATECELVNETAATLLRQMAHAARTLHHLIGEFALVDDVSSLARWYEGSELCFSSEFFPLVGAFFRDAVSAGDFAMQERLRRALRLRTKVARVARTLPSLDFKVEFDREPLLKEPGFHVFLERWSKILARSGHAAAVPTRQIASYLRDRTRLESALRRRQEKSDGWTEVRVPTTAEMAELWFLRGSEPFISGLRSLARAVGSREMTLHEGRKKAEELGVAEMLADEDTPANKRPSPAEVKVHVTAAFCEHVLWQPGPVPVTDTLRLYKSTIDGQEAACLSEKGHGTHVLHYGMAVARSWRLVEEPQILISDSIPLITSAISVADESVSPRLVRDLYFNRARLFESLGIWRPETYSLAEQDYENGLAVKAVAHEADARGRALGDLANTIQRGHNSELTKYDGRILGLYREALHFLSANEFPVSRATVLVSYAAFLLDREKDDPSYDTELALSKTTEAIDLLETKVSAEERTIYVQNVLAAAYLNHGNAVRQRSYGEPLELLKAAQESYRRASDILKGHKHNQLRGTILLNSAQVALDCYDITGESLWTQSAWYAYSEAATELAEFPREFAHTMFRRAVMSMMSDDPEIDDLPNALADIKNAVNILQRIGDKPAAARARFSAGLLVRAESARTGQKELDEAVRELAAAYELFADCEEHAGAIMAARQLADVLITLHSVTGQRSQPEDASRYLDGGCEHLERLWNQNSSIEERAQLSVRYGGVYEERAWCGAMLGAEPFDVIQIASLGKARELSSHVSFFHQRRRSVSPEVAAYLDLLRSETQRLETSRWALQRDVMVGRSVANEIRSVEDDRSRLRERIELFRPEPHSLSSSDLRTRIKGFLRKNENAWLCDLTITRWGTVLVVVSPDSAKLILLPAIRTHELKTWLFGKNGGNGWAGSYDRIAQSSPPERILRRREWAEETDKLVSWLSDSIIKPIFEAIQDLENSWLLLSPGAFSGLPLHAAQAGSSGKRLFEVAKGVAYVPTTAILEADPYELGLRGPALCILSDPARSFDDELKESPKEVAEVVTILNKNGLPVTVLAAVGSKAGRAVFEHRGIAIPHGVNVAEESPTCDWVLTNANRFGLIFYSGHGVAGGSNDTGLLLSAQDQNEPSLLSIEDVLGMAELALRPQVYLSACKTAHGTIGVTEQFSFASALVRCGAGFVLGTMWNITDECSRIFAETYFQALADSKAAPTAFCVALRQLISARATGAKDSSGIPLDHAIYWAAFVPLIGA